jgi:thioredoxin reductase
VIEMIIDIKVLENLLRLNKHIKIEFIENTSILEIKSNNNLLSTIELKNNIIKDNASLIYNTITNLTGINLYIPKTYYTKKNC